MKIIALKYGESVFGENHIFKGGDKKRLLPISFTIYLIQTQSKNILVDVGCDDGAGFEMSVFKKPVDVLREYGVEANEVTDVVITHAHLDHISALGYYSNATVHIQEDEYQKGKKYFSSDAFVNLFKDEFDLEERIKIKKIGGHSVGSCIVLADNYVLCGDECYYEKNLTEKLCTGATYCEEKSKNFIAEYSNPKYNCLLFHDPKILTGSIGFMIIADML